MFSARRDLRAELLGEMWAVAGRALGHFPILTPTMSEKEHTVWSATKEVGKAISRSLSFKKRRPKKANDESFPSGTLRDDAIRQHGSDEEL